MGGRVYGLRSMFEVQKDQVKAPREPVDRLKKLWEKHTGDESVKKEPVVRTKKHFERRPVIQEPAKPDNVLASQPVKPEMGWGKRSASPVTPSAPPDHATELKNRFNRVDNLQQKRLRGNLSVFNLLNDELDALELYIKKNPQWPSDHYKGECKDVRDIMKISDKNISEQLAKYAQLSESERAEQEAQDLSYVLGIEKEYEHQHEERDDDTMMQGKETIKQNIVEPVPSKTQRFVDKIKISFRGKENMWNSEHVDGDDTFE